MEDKSRSRHNSQGRGKACGGFANKYKDRNKRGEPPVLVAKGINANWCCIVDIPNSADLQVLETKINVPENMGMGTHKYI